MPTRFASPHPESAPRAKRRRADAVAVTAAHDADDLHTSELWFTLYRRVGTYELVCLEDLASLPRSWLERNAYPHGSLAGYAACHGRLEILIALASLGVDLDRPDDKALYTPAHWAAFQGHAACLHFLVARGAQLECETRGGNTPLMLACRAGRTETVRFLASNGARRVTRGSTAVALLQSKGHVELADWMEATTHWNTRLHYAPVLDAASAHVLCAAGANPFVKDPTGGPDAPSPLLNARRAIAAAESAGEAPPASCALVIEQAERVKTACLIGARLSRRHVAGSAIKSVFSDLVLPFLVAKS